MQITPAPPNTALLALFDKHGSYTISSPMQFEEAYRLKQQLNCGHRHQRAWLLEPDSHALIRTIGLWFAGKRPARPQSQPAPAAPAAPAPIATDEELEGLRNQVRRQMRNFYDLFRFRAT